MIIAAEIIDQPYSGEYVEKIYDNESVWNSQGWTYIKFTNDDYSDWCGHFRGIGKKVAVSTINNIVLVLTSDYLYQLDRESGNLTDIEDHPTYRNLTVTPNGHFVLADFYNMEKITTNIKLKDEIECLFRMDNIDFKKWSNNNLEFSCTPFADWDRHLTMIYDCQTGKIEYKHDE